MDSHGKRRRLHMDHQQEFNYARTTEGAAPLTSPSVVTRSYQDSNRGLYPRTRQRRSIGGSVKLNLVENQLLNTAVESGINKESSFGGNMSYLPSQCPGFQSAKLFSQNGHSDSNPAFRPSISGLNASSLSDKEEGFQSPPRRTSSRQKIIPKKVCQRACQKHVVQSNTLKRYFDSNRLSPHPVTQFVTFIDCEEAAIEAVLDQSSSSRDELQDSHGILNRGFLLDSSDTSENLVEPSNVDISAHRLLESYDVHSDTSDMEDFNATYGLVDTQTQSTVSSYFSFLPLNVLENIFCHLPMLDLCLTASRVNQNWRQVISNAQFMPWKKRYHRMKCLKNKEVLEEIESIAIAHGMEHQSEFLFGLIRYMKTFSWLSRCNIHECLSWHPKYSWAVEFANERLQDCITDGVHNAGSLIAILCIIAGSVQDISGILCCLFHNKNNCPSKDVLECLYCIATFFYHFNLKGHLCVGMHYRLCHAIFLHENSSRVCVGDLSFLSMNHDGQQSILKYGDESCGVKLSSEQLRIINHVMRPRETLKIVAFAGTGKTTTLVQFTKMSPNLKFLHIAYNKSVSDHAKKVFPSNVECRTIHSLAMNDVGHRYRHKLCSKVVPLQVLHLVKFPNKMMGAGYALKTLTNYMNSSDEFISVHHVPKPVITSFSDLKDASTMIANDANLIWRHMIDPSNLKVKIVHDTYLKLFQLKKPMLGEYDCILVDEAQDCNAAMIDIIHKQDCCKILVGDPHQQIYGFRGAIGSLDQIEATHTFYLTQSFRFGPKIAYVATCALDVLKGVHNQCLFGLNKADGYQGTVEGQEAVIARSNHVLFGEVVKMCLANPTLQAAFAGGLPSYNFDQILDIYHMSQYSAATSGDVPPIRDKFISHFKSFASLQAYAHAVEDQDLLGKIKIVRMYGSQIPLYIALIKERCKFSMDSAAVIFSTAHKAKGLEFTTVKLTEDFLPGGFNYYSLTDSVGFRRNLGTNYPDDEANILYVAMTRAKKRLVLSSAVLLMLLAANETFESIVASSLLQGNITENGNDLKCIACNHWTHVPVSSLVLTRETIKVKNNTVLGGPLCCVCAAKPTYLLDELVPVVSISPELYNKTHIVLDSFVGPTSEKIRGLIHPSGISDQLRRLPNLSSNNHVIPIFINQVN